MAVVGVTLGSLLAADAADVWARAGRGGSRGSQTNRVERLDIRRAEVSEAWQEGGQDYVTVLVAASMLDYTVDDATGAVVDGSRTAPQDIEDFWTFTRPVGNNPWKLSAIQST